MTTALTNPQNRIADYVTRLAQSNPAEALQISLAEAEKERALAEKAQAEYRALAEVTFDSEGRIATANLAGLWRLAQMYAGSAMVPEHYRGKPHDCFIACEMAFRLRVAVFAYMQLSYIVHGKPGIEAKLAVAMLNTSGKIKGRISYKLEGSIKNKDRACTASAIDADTGEIVSATIDWAMVEAEGWASKSGSKWKSMPDVMFHYRSATFLIRLFYPEVMMGMRTTDELEDVGEEAPPARNLNELAARIEGPSNGNGQHPEPDDPVSQAAADAGERPQTAEEPDSDLRDFCTMELNAVEQIGDVEGLRASLGRKAQTDADRTMVNGLCDARIEAIRASRAGRANKT